MNFLTGLLLMLTSYILDLIESTKARHLRHKARPLATGRM